MHHLITVETAGVNFIVSCRNNVTLLQLSSSYGPFLSPGRSPGNFNVDILLELGVPPRTGRMTKIFDSNQSWSLFLCGEEYILSLRNPADIGRPVWEACFKRDMKEVTIYCGETLIGRKEGMVTLMNPFSYPLDQILLMHILARRKGAILHAAGIAIDYKGYIFPGRSGAGKSTLSREFSAKGNYGVLSDDRVAVRRTGDELLVYGTPWPGEERIAANRKAPLKGIFFISHGASDRIEEIGRRIAIERLLPVVSIPWYDRELSEKALFFCEDLVSSIPSYVLYFKPGREVVGLFDAFIPENAAGLAMGS